MWSEGSGSFPDPDTLIQFLLTPMNKSSNDENAPKKVESKSCTPTERATAPEQAARVDTGTAGDGHGEVARRIWRLEQRVDELRSAGRQSRSPSPPVKDTRERRVTFAVRNSDRSTSESEALTAELASDPEVLAMVSTQQCKLCSAYAQRYREEQRERVKQEVTCATLGQALCVAEAERDKLKSGLGHIQSEIQRMKEETVRLGSTREKTARELRRSEEDRSDLQLKLKVMSECVRKRDLELSIQRQALDDRDRRLKDTQSDVKTTSSKLLMAQEHVHQLTSDNTSQTQMISEFKDLLAEREKQHMAEMKKKHCADNPVVQKLIHKAVEEARSGMQKEAFAIQHKAAKESSGLKKDSERMAMALAKFKERFTELADEKSVLLERHDQLKQQLADTVATSKQKDDRVAELNKTLKTIRLDIENLETQRKNDQTTHTASVAFLENKVKQLEAAQAAYSQEKASIGNVKKQMEATEKRYSEEATLRRAGDARLAVLKQQLEEMTTEHTTGVAKATQLRGELAKALEDVAAKEKQATTLTEQLRTLKQAANSSRGRGDASSEVETERRRSYRLQVELDRLSENKATLIGRLEHAERELDRCATKNEAWSKLWEEKVELIRKLESQVKMGRSINEDKVDSLRKERDRAMDLAKQAAKKLQSLDSEYEAKMDEMHTLFEAQLDGVRAAKDHEIQKSTERVREIEAMLAEVSTETAASRSSLEDKMRRISIITKSFQS